MMEVVNIKLKCVPLAVVNLLYGVERKVKRINKIIRQCLKKPILEFFITPRGIVYLQEKKKKYKYKRQNIKSFVGERQV
jgi:hypothetical protein